MEERKSYWLVEVCTNRKLGPASEEMVEAAKKSTSGIIDYPWHGITLKVKVATNEQI